MARSTAVALPRPATRVNTTLLAWGGLTLAGALLLPWARTGRDLAVFAPQSAGLELLARDWPVALAVVCAAAAGSLGLASLPLFKRGRMALVIGAVGALAALWRLLSVGAPMGPGAFVAILGFLTVIGIGLALGGYVRADAFIGSCIVWAAAFVVVFILFPLWSVLKASVFVKGRFTLDVVRDTIQSPGFLLINNPATPLDEG
ncbi:MAG: hypothetical protein ACRDGN_05045, partial [bacterium]